MPRARERIDALLLLLARLLIAVLFLGGAVQKLDPSGAQALLEMRGWPLWLVWPAQAFNLAAGLALVAGLWTRPVALLLAAYCAVTSNFHWQPDDPWQMTIFVKNWSIAGGCLALAVAGPGRWAWRPKGVRTRDI